MSEASMKSRTAWDRIVLAAALMQITGTAYIVWMGVSSASNGETKRATWAFIVVVLYALSMVMFLMVWRKSSHQESSDLAKEVEALKTSNLQHQQEWAKDRATLLKKIEALENPIPHVAMSAYSPGSREAHIEEQWRSLNASEKEAVRFVLFNGTATQLQLINHMQKEGFTDGLSVMRRVQAKSTFVTGNINELDPEFSINSEVKADLMRLSR
jgi:ABC-type nickel/cobalt efflux system permease component RcnA